MYSIDRAKALEYTISCLQKMDLFEQCQKTLIVDGKIDRIPLGWDHIQVPRIENKFCWGRMWDAGVYTSKYEKVLYLDSDRLLPPSYLSLVNQNLKDDVFIYTSKHFIMAKDLPLQLCEKMLLEIGESGALLEKEFIGTVRFDPRYGKPFHGPGKNVMSGSTAFTKKTYKRLGGVDHWYCGHGAFADTDFHLQASQMNCQFIDLEVNELHFPHEKLDDEARTLDNTTLWRLSLDNFIYYCLKWKLPMTLAENLAYKSGIVRPSRYLKTRVEELTKSLNLKE